VAGSGLVPDEEFPANTNDDRPRQYGMPLWRDMFSPRQLLGHCTSVEVFQELVDECGGPGKVNELDAAAMTHIALAIDKILNSNWRMSVWMPTRQVVANTFKRHDFAFCWSHAEMASAQSDGGPPRPVPRTRRRRSPIRAWRVFVAKAVMDGHRTDWSPQVRR